MAEHGLGISLEQIQRRYPEMGEVAAKNLFGAYSISPTEDIRAENTVDDLLDPIAVEQARKYTQQSGEASA